MPETSQETLERELELIAMCDATPVLVSDETHDNEVALTSHAPHVMAPPMAARLVDSSNDVARLAGQGLRDTIRIANGAPAGWADTQSRRNSPLTDRVLITVEVGNEPGDLARTLFVPHDFDVTSDDVTLHAAGEETPTVSVAIPASAEREVRRSLPRAGWGAE